MRYWSLLRVPAELALAFCVVISLDVWLTGGTGFAAVSPNPYWLPVLLMSVGYGSGGGLAAALLASSVWLSVGHPPLAIGENPFDHLLAISLPPMLWVMTSVSIGEVTALRRRRIAQQNGKIQKLQKNIDAAVAKVMELGQTNRELQVQAAINDRSVADAVAIALRLLDRNPATLPRILTELVTLASRQDDFTIYTYQVDEWTRLAAGEGAGDRPSSLPVAQAEAIIANERPKHFGEGTDRAMLAGIGTLALPLSSAEGCRARGVLVLHAMPPEDITRRALIDVVAIGSWLGPLMRQLEGLPALHAPAVLAIVPTEDAA